MAKLYGITPVRRCNQDEQKLIQERFSKLKHVMEQNKRDWIYWAHIYVNQEYCLETQEKQRDIMKWVEKLLIQIQGSPQYICSVGFTNNPGTCIGHQHFHYDYNTKYKGLFIPMVDFNYCNSPQFFQFPLKSDPKINDKGNYDRFGQNQKELLENEGVDFMTISQVICKPYTILKLQPGTVHRGIQNTTGMDRYLLYVGYNDQKMVLQSEQHIDQ